MERLSPRQNRRQAIINAAITLFREQGYERTAVRDLADAVGMQSGSLFYHFDSKEEILVAVIEDGINRALQFLDAGLATAVTPRDKLRALIHSHLRILHAGQPNAILMFGSEWNSLAQENKTALIAKADSYEARLNQILREVQISGEIEVEDVKIFRLFLLGALNWTTQWYRQDGLSIEELTEQFMSFIVEKN